MKTIIRKYLIFFVTGVFVFTAVGTGLLIFLNNSYLKDKGTFSVVKLTKTVVSSSPVRKINIGGSAQKLLVSHDGNYLAYLESGSLKVADIANDRIYSVTTVPNMQVADYKWIYDRDRLIIAEKFAYYAYAKLYYYDVAGKTLTEIRDNYHNQDIRVPLSSENSTVSDLDFSAQTNLTFLKLTNDSGFSRLWLCNVMVSSSRLPDTVTESIGNIICLKLKNLLLYEDRENGAVYQYGSQNKITVDGESRFKLLGVDQNDNVYLAHITSSGLTDMIYSGSLSDNNWRKTFLITPISSTKIHVTYTGNIYADNIAQPTLTNLSNGSQKAYIGKLIGVYDNGFLSESNGVVSQESIY